MKNPRTYLVLLVLVAMTGISFDEPYYHPYSPTFMMRDAMEGNIKLKEPQSIENAGKIYIKDHLIFINEKYRGVHVIDNSDPKNPNNFAFISIDGCIDMAVKGDVLYADNAIDLIAIQFSADVTSINLTERIENVFPELISPEGRYLSWQENAARPEGAILVRWDER